MAAGNPIYLLAPTGTLIPCWNPATGIPCFGINTGRQCWENGLVFSSGNLSSAGPAGTGWDFKSAFNHNPNTELLYLWSYQDFNLITGNPPVLPSGFPPDGTTQFFLWSSGNYGQTCCNALNYDNSVHGPYPNYLPKLPASSIYISTSGVFTHSLCFDNSGHQQPNPMISGAKNLQTIYVFDGGNSAKTLALGGSVSSPLCGASGNFINSPCYSTIQWVDPSGYSSPTVFGSGLYPLPLGFAGNLSQSQVITTVNFTPNSMFTVPGNMNSFWACASPCWLPSTYANPTISLFYADKSFSVNGNLYFPPSGYTAWFPQPAQIALGGGKNTSIQPYLVTDMFVQGHDQYTVNMTYATNCTPLINGSVPLVTYYVYYYLYAWVGILPVGYVTSSLDIPFQGCNPLLCGMGNIIIATLTNNLENKYSWYGFADSMNQIEGNNTGGVQTISYCYIDTSGNQRSSTTNITWQLLYNNNLPAFVSGVANTFGFINNNTFSDGHNIVHRTNIGLTDLRQGFDPVIAYGSGSFPLFTSAGGGNQTSFSFSQSPPNAIVPASFFAEPFMSGYIWNCDLGIINFQRNQFDGPPISGNQLGVATLMWNPP